MPDSAVTSDPRARARALPAAAAALVRVFVRVLGLGLALTLGAAVARAQAPAPAGAADREDESALLVEDARRRIAARDYDAAARRLDRALALNPRRIDTYVLRAGVHGARRQYAAGIELLRRARQLAPDSPDVLTALGSQLLLAGQVDEGVPLLEQVTERFPDRYDAHLLLGYHHAGAGDHRRAITSIEAYLRTRPASLRGEDASHRLGLADAYLRAGQSRKARDIFRAVLDQRPRSLRARMGLAWATAAIDCREALPVLEGLGELTGRYPEIELVYGHCELATDQAARAETRARRLIERDGRQAAAHALLGEALLARGDAAGARAALRSALDRDAARPGRSSRRHVTLRLAHVERQSGDPAAALALLDELGPMSGNAAADPAWAIELGEALIAAGRPDEAVARLTPVATALPAAGAPAGVEDREAWKAWEVLEVLGLALYRTGDTAGAVQHLERAVAARPDSQRARATLADVLTLLAEARVRARDLDAAEDIFARASEALPSPRTWRNLGIIRLARGRAADAIAPLERAADAGDPVARHLQARALAQTGKLIEARQVFAVAVRARRSRADRIAVALDLAAMELAGGDPDRAMAALQDMEKLSAGDEAARAALVTARHAAGYMALRRGSYSAAVQFLETAEDQARGDALVGIRCHLVLAALLAGERRKARARLDALEQAGATCRFPDQVDRVAVPILEALARGLDPSRAPRELERLQSLRRRNAGAARDAIDSAVRVLATIAAIQAHARGRLDEAARHLGEAARVEGSELSPETRHNLAALDVARERNLPEAMATLEELASRFPEALIHLAIAHDRRGEPREALELYERAQQRRVRFAPLAEWIAARRRVLGIDAPAEQPAEQPGEQPAEQPREQP
jgi:tetratricopeptide (TPR) repeat protein